MSNGTSSMARGAQEALGQAAEEVRQQFGNAADLFGQSGHFVERVRNFVRSKWESSPFLRWYSYIAATYGVIPAVVLIGWIIGTLAIVVGIAGIGIVCAEGFLAFLGSLVFFPVVGVLLFIACIGGLIGAFTYIGIQAVTFFLSGIGIMAKEGPLDTEHAKRAAKRATGEFPTFS
ncbi:hypothetical protein G9A89_015295 [Geosiphon pyriformis]|nr:hypothetical protein G9A89_015295 [Geosiphon pyriformis]